MVVAQADVGSQVPEAHVVLNESGVVGASPGAAEHEGNASPGQIVGSDVRVVGIRSRIVEGGIGDTETEELLDREPLVDASDLDLVDPARPCEGGRDPVVVEGTVRVGQDRRVAGGWIQRELGETAEGGDIDDGGARKHVLPAEAVVLVVGRNRLVLPVLFLGERVRDVAGRPAEDRGQTKRVGGVGRAGIEPQECPLAVPIVIEIVEVDRVGEIVGTGCAQGGERPKVFGPGADGGPALVGGELRITAVDLSLERRAERGLRRHVDDGPDLLAVLGGNVPIDDLQGLGDARVERVRERHAGLVGDRLTVDDELRLAVGALEMKPAVLVLGEPGRGGQDLLHGAGRDGGRRPLDVGLVDVDVRHRGVGFELGGGRLGLDLYGLGHAGEFERDVDLLGNGAPDVDRLMSRFETLNLDVHLVRVEGNVEELVPAVLVSSRLGVESGDVVSKNHRDAAHGLAVRPRHGSVHGPGRDGRVGGSSERKTEQGGREEVRERSQLSVGHVEPS